MSEQLRSIYARWERLEEEKAATSADLKELFLEAKGNGYEPKALRIAFRLKAKADGPEAADTAATAALVETYISALSFDAGVRLSRASAPARVEIIEEIPRLEPSPAAPPPPPAVGAKTVPAPTPRPARNDDLDLPPNLRRERNANDDAAVAAIMGRLA